MYTYRSGIGQVDRTAGGFAAGKNYLILAPPGTIARELMYALAKPLPGEYALVISTNDRASEVIDAFKRAGADKRFVGTIDAITKSSSPNVIDTNRLMFVANPSDLTGIGIKFSKMIELIFDGSFSGAENELFPPPIRFCVNSISTFLMYRKLDVLYQFLHIIASKVKKSDGVGFYLINSGSFDDKTISMIEQLMDGVIEVKTEGDAGFLRMRGIEGGNPDWLRFSLQKGTIVAGP
ncbi:MAG TPA: hypothetical protein P5217_01900 [Methanoregulaceae archaeon]|nr:hypothetical protein [Methanoregulaceae archaeon]